MADVTTTTFELDTPDGPMPAFAAAPDGDAPRGGVVVVQEAFGLTGHIESVARRIAQEGYVAVAPALFHRQGSPVFAYDGDRSELMPAIMALTAEGIAADVDAALAHLADQGFPSELQGIVGFCMGGTVTFATAARTAIGAAVTFYGGGVAEGRFGFPSLVDQASDLKTPWLGLYGDLDQGIPVDDVEALRAAVADAPVEAEVVRYAEADHGFNCDERASFHPESAADAWSRMLAFFAAHLG